jgi:uncharacterized RDD family membrane protein YckC
MIDAGSVGPGSLVAKVGASQWSAVADVPAFAVYLRGLQSGPLKYAGFWIRLLAFVIDWLLLNIIAFVAAAIIGFIIGFAAGASGGGTGSDFDTLMRVIGALVGLAAALFYYIYFPAGSWQATPGKRICGIYIIRQNGRRVSGPLALGRYLSYLISSLPVGLGFLMIGWTDQKKGLHDMICGTRVVYGKL